MKDVILLFWHTGDLHEPKKFRVQAAQQLGHCSAGTLGLGATVQPIAGGKDVFWGLQFMCNLGV